MPGAQFGKAWAVTFRFKLFPVAWRNREKERERRNKEGVRDSELHSPA